MEIFEVDMEGDLFNILLDNPEYEISTNQACNSFTQKLQTSYPLQCFICLNRIQKCLIYYKEEAYCVGCFCKNYQEQQPYLTIDLSKKCSDESRWSLFEQLQIINEMSKLGVENYEEITKKIDFQINEHQVKEYQKSFLQYKQNQETMHFEVSKKQPWKEMYQSFTNSLLMSQYQVVDYMLANLHEKSSHQDQIFLISNKIKEDKQMERMRKTLQRLSKDYSKNSAHPQEIDQFDEQMSLSDLQLGNSTGEQEFRERSTKLLLQADAFIERSRQMIQNKKIASLKISDEYGPTKKNHLIKKQEKKQRKSTNLFKNKPIKTYIQG